MTPSKTEVKKALTEVEALLAELPGMPEFYKEIVKIIRIHSSKSQDYTGATDDPLFNFKFTAGFNKTSLKWAFRHHQGNKIARMLALDSTDEQANNESISDTNRDLAVYLLLELAARASTGDKFFATVDMPSANIQNCS